VEEKGTEEKDKFYENLEQIYNKTPKKDVKIILGDFNAKIGKEHLFKPITALYNKQEESSESGQRATDFAEAKNVHIGSTFFPHKTIHKETWISPDGKTKIELIL
jgi:exonuclease III